MKFDIIAGVSVGSLNGVLTECNEFEQRENFCLRTVGYDVLLSRCCNPILEPNLSPTDLFILDNRMPISFTISNNSPLRRIFQ